MDDDLRSPKWHNNGESRFMAEKDGWVMVRRSGCVPYTVTKREWLALPSAENGRRWSKAYGTALTPEA